MGGAAPQPRLCALARCATRQAGLLRATRGGPISAARSVVILVRSSGYGLRYTPSGSARVQAVKCHENTPDRLLDHHGRCLPANRDGSALRIARSRRSPEMSKTMLPLTMNT